MSKRANHLTTVVVEKGTLKTLKHMARKDESYDQLINSLINLRLMNKNNTVHVNENENVNENSDGSGLVTQPVKASKEVFLINND